MPITASDIFRILTFSALSLFRDMQAYTSIFSIIKAYSGLFRHIQHVLFPSHIHDLVILRALVYLEQEAYSKPYKTLTKHIEDPAITRTVFSSITQSYSGIFRTLCNAYMCRNLAYSEYCNIRNQVFSVGI